MTGGEPSQVLGASWTFWAACVAACASLLNVFLLMRHQRSESHRSAFRTGLREKLPEMSEAVWSVAALSRKAINATDSAEERFREADAKVTALDRLRRSLRYELWGLDEGFRAYCEVPGFVRHLRERPQVGNVFLDEATRLRQALDTAIANAYERGGRPSRLDRFRVRRRAHALRKAFKDTGPRKPPSHD